MSNLTLRFITGFIGVGLMLSAVIWNEYACSALFLFIAVMAMREFYSWSEKNQIQPQKFLGFASGIILYLFFSFFHEFFKPGFFLLLIPSVFGIFIMELYTRSEKPFMNIAFTILGVVYLALPMAFMNLISKAGMDGTVGTYHPQIIIGYLFLVWSDDIGAYFFGKKFGKHKLFERISPKKTWEGSVGGAGIALIMAFIVSKYFMDIRLLDWIIIACIVMVAGTLGDLVESMFKRSIHIKDSGNVLPGHGGFLDRFDSFFISAPFVYMYLSLMNN